MFQRAVASALVPILLLAAACGDDDDASDVPSSATAAASSTSTVPSSDVPSSDVPSSDVPSSGFDDARCEANREAGTITFLTGFDFAAAASIVEVVNAETLGYYDELCLDVELRSSFSTANYALVAGGEAQFASGGSFAEVVAFAAANDAELVAVTVAGRTPIDTLIVKPGVAATLADLAGATIGIKGKLPSSVAIMLAGAGLEEGVDFETVPVDGFDPVAHMAIDALDGVPGWKSNEPGRLEREGVPFETFDPSELGIPGTFGAIFTTRQFLDEHPTAAEDFVRATLRGLAAAIADPAAAAAAAVELVTANGNPNFLSPEGEVFRWATEAELIASTTPPGEAPGAPDPAALAAEVNAYAEVGLYGDGPAPAIDDHVDASVAAAVVADDGTVIWPA